MEGRAPILRRVVEHIDAVGGTPEAFEQFSLPAVRAPTQEQVDYRLEQLRVESHAQSRPVHEWGRIESRFRPQDGRLSAGSSGGSGRYSTSSIAGRFRAAASAAP